MKVNIFHCIICFKLHAIHFIPKLIQMDFSIHLFQQMDNFLLIFKDILIVKLANIFLKPVDFIFNVIYSQIYSFTYILFLTYTQRQFVTHSELLHEYDYSFFATKSTSTDISLDL